MSRKTVFVTGLFPERNALFFSEMCRNFRVIAFKGCGFPNIPQMPHELAEDLVPAEAMRQAMLPHFHQVHQAASYIEGRLKGALSGAQSLSLSEFSRLNQVSGVCSADVAVFRELAKSVTIDTVVVNADYDYIRRRGIVMAARELGIPCLGIEHGFMGGFASRSSFKPWREPILEYACDRVNFDSPLEVQIALSRGQGGKVGHASEALALGTPQVQGHETVRDPAVSRRELGLATDSTVVALMGTWFGTRTISGLLRAQREQRHFLRDLLGRLPSRAAEQWIHKVHPTYGSSRFAETRRWWERLASQVGATAPPIFADRLQEVMASSDVIVSTYFSSILWDAVVLGKPAILVPLPYLQETLCTPGALRRGNPVYESGCIEVADGIEDLLSRVESYRDPGARSRAFERSRAFLGAQGHGRDTELEKARRVCAQIAAS